MEPKFAELMQYAFFGLVSLSLAQLIRIFSKMAVYIEKLNDKFATLLERVAWHGKQIELHDTKIDRLEKANTKGE